MLRPCVFLDRDGVLNERAFPFVRRADRMVLKPAVAESARRITDAGFACVIATNQEFVAHGWIEPEQHEAMMAKVIAEMRRLGGKVDGAYACLHKRYSGCHDAKPKPGMLTDAARDLGLDLKRSFMVGDNRKDMQAGRAAGCTTVLVDPRFRTRWQNAGGFTDHVAKDLPRAVDWILSRPRHVV